MLGLLYLPFYQPLQLPYLPPKLLFNTIDMILQQSEEAGEVHLEPVQILFILFLSLNIKIEQVNANL